MMVGLQSWRRTALEKPPAKWVTLEATVVVVSAWVQRGGVVARLPLLRYAPPMAARL